MSPRGLRIALVVVALVLLLFAGRWSAGLMADRWWAATLSPAAATFVTDWAVLRLVLELTGVLLASAWFIGHLLIVYRAIGSVQVHRRLANLEIREAVNLQALAVVSIAGGLLLGLVTGRGVGDWTPTVVLGWTGFQMGETEPFLGRDIGYYLAELPLWRQVHGFALLLVLLALGGAATLYAVIGALRWIDRRLALNDHARAHLGALLVLLAAVLAWGYAREPAELVAGVIGTVHSGLFAFRTTVAFVLTGLALGTAILSAVWALRGRHTLLLTSWVLLGASSLLGHHVVPALMAPAPGSTLEPAVRRKLDQIAYGMITLRDTQLVRQPGPVRPPEPPALWQPTLANLTLAPDSSRVAAVDRAVVSLHGRPRPAWLVVRVHPGDGATTSVLLDDRVTGDGRPILYTDPDSLRTSAGAPTLRLPRRGIWPGARGTVIDTVPGGVPVGTGLRRLVLAWALQSGELLEADVAGRQAFWHLDPVERVGKLAPYATWGAPAPRLIGGELVWLVDGYLPSPTFPASTRVRWRGEWVGSLRAAFLGVVRGESGATSIYLRHGSDEVAKEWQALFPGILQPASAIPTEVLRNLSYPQEALEAQLRVLAAPQWGLGQAIGRGDPIGVEGPPEAALWEADTSGIQQLIPFEQPPERYVSAVVRARTTDGWAGLTILRLDSLLALPDPMALQTRWGRFPTFQQLKDSIEKAGARLEQGAVRYWLTTEGLGAYQAYFARRDREPPVLAWVSLAIGERGGAGHDLDEAWQNFLGLSAPVISAGARGTQLIEARRLLDQADQALRRGDLEGFGRAWEALKRTLRSP
jgi:uncharacterized membrane protein (UPF0182 family)